MDSLSDNQLQTLFLSSANIFERLKLFLCNKTLNCLILLVWTCVSGWKKVILFWKSRQVGRTWSSWNAYLPFHPQLKNFKHNVCNFLEVLNLKKASLILLYILCTSFQITSLQEVIHKNFILKTFTIFFDLSKYTIDLFAKIVHGLNNWTIFVNASIRCLIRYKLCSRVFSSF